MSKRTGTSDDSCQFILIIIIIMTR